jgi:hypothetical protein
MPNIPGMGAMPQMSGRAGRKLAAQAGTSGADFDMLTQLMGESGQAPAFPGLLGAGPTGAPRPIVSTNKGTKKKKKGGRVTPPKDR